MKKILLITLAVGSLNSSLALPPMIGGDFAKPDEFTSSVKIYIKSNCSATKIAAKYYLTAAHCVLSKGSSNRDQVKDYSISLYNTKGESYHSEITDVFVTDDYYGYNSGELSYIVDGVNPFAGVVSSDVAIIKIKDDFEDISISEVSFDKVGLDQKIIIGGYGCERSGSSSIYKYKYATLKTTPLINAYTDLYGENALFSDEMRQYFRDSDKFNIHFNTKINNGVSGCSGDSGGAAFNPVNMKIVGVYSHALYRSEDNKRVDSAFARIDHLKEWFLEKTQEFGKVDQIIKDLKADDACESQLFHELLVKEKTTEEQVHKCTLENTSKLLSFHKKYKLNRLDNIKGYSSKEFRKKVNTLISKAREYISLIQEKDIKLDDDFVVSSLLKEQLFKNNSVKSLANLYSNDFLKLHDLKNYMNQADLNNQLSLIKALDHGDVLMLLEDTPNTEKNIARANASIFWSTLRSKNIDILSHLNGKLKSNLKLVADFKLIESDFLNLNGLDKNDKLKKLFKEDFRGIINSKSFWSFLTSNEIDLLNDLKLKASDIYELVNDFENIRSRYTFEDLLTINLKDLMSEGYTKKDFIDAGIKLKRFKEDGFTLKEIGKKTFSIEDFLEEYKVSALYAHLHFTPLEFEKAQISIDVIIKELGERVIKREAHNTGHFSYNELIEKGVSLADLKKYVALTPLKAKSEQIEITLLRPTFTVKELIKVYPLKDIRTLYCYSYKNTCSGSEEKEVYFDNLFARQDEWFKEIHAKGYRMQEMYEAGFTAYDAYYTCDRWKGVFNRNDYLLETKKLGLSIVEYYNGHFSPREILRMGFKKREIKRALRAAGIKVRNRDF